MHFVSRADFDELLRCADRYKAADLHLGPGRAPIIRVAQGLIEMVEYPHPLSTADMDIMLEIAARSPTGPSSVQALDDLDFTYIPARTAGLAESNVSVYRVNASLSLEGIRLVMRRLPSAPPTLEQIEAPEAYVNVLKNQRQGLVLVTGPTGSGKSTTLAAGVRYLLESGSGLHFITLENPVEYRYTTVNQMGSYITQRELNRSLKDFKVGMKSALRQDPDVILVGELRDLETIRLAMEAAETGHLVFATTHVTDVASTISRMIQMFPKEEQVAARVQLLGALRFVICQRLLPAVPNGRVAAREFLEFTPALRRELIELDPSNMMTRLIDATTQYGISMMDAIRNIHKEGRISDDKLREWELILQEESHG
jgi:twitching motility protein PilT